MLFERHLKTSIIICFASKLRFQSIKLKFYSSTVFDCLNWLSKEKKDWYPNVRIHSPVASISDHCWTDRNWIKPSKSPVLFWNKFQKSLTSISIRLWTIAILKTIGPGSFILCWCRCWLSDSIATLESLSPFSSVEPLPPTLHSQSMTLPILPMTLKETATENVFYINNWIQFVTQNVL